MNKNQRLITVIIIAAIALACNLPGGAPPTGTEIPISPSALVVTDTSVPPTETPPAPATVCSATLVTNTDSNVRSGPGQVYNVIGFLTQGSTAVVDGKSTDGGWWYIQFAAGTNGHGWIAGSITTANCVPSTIPIVAAPPTPVLPTATLTTTPAPASPTSTNSGGIIFPPIITFPPGFFNTKTPTPTLPIFIPITFFPPIFITP
ncbi:MAG: SH3 domain-containing protein [Anaerolineales bacterium]|nr:SH3 domain-containing protein [Anaerolineales bacterium]